MPGAERFAANLTRFTGGNPLYVLETLKYLLETGGLERSWPEHLPLMKHCSFFVEKRVWD